MIPWVERLAWRPRPEGAAPIVCAQTPGRDREGRCAACTLRWRAGIGYIDRISGREAIAWVQDHLAFHEGRS